MERMEHRTIEQSRMELSALALVPQDDKVMCRPAGRDNVGIAVPVEIGHAKVLAGNVVGELVGGPFPGIRTTGDGGIELDSGLFPRVGSPPAGDHLGISQPQDVGGGQGMALAQGVVDDRTDPRTCTVPGVINDDAVVIT